MAKRTKRPRSEVRLVSYTADGSVFERLQISYDQYYGGGTAALDSDEFRSEHGIRRLTGEIFNSKGELQQSFDNSYGENGEYVRSRIVNADGTVFED